MPILPYALAGVGTMATIAASRKKPGPSPSVSLPALPSAPAAAPTPTPSDVSPELTEQQRLRRTKQLKKGLLSTIKTKPFGTIGAGPAVNIPAAGGKTMLGA